jgi:hypothetical protein
MNGKGQSVALMFFGRVNSVVLRALCASVVTFFYHGDTEITEVHGVLHFSVFLCALRASVVTFFRETEDTDYHGAVTKGLSTQTPAASHS